MNAPVSNHLRGLTAVRYVKSLAAAKADPLAAIAYAAGQNWRDTPNVVTALKASAMNTDDQSALLGPVGFDFSEFLRPQTIIGRLAGLRKVPFQTRVLQQDAGVSASWTGEAQPAPVSRASFSGETLALLKVMGHAVVTDQLARSSAPSAEAALSRDLGRAGSQALDVAFISPSNAGEADVKPASITNGAPSFTSSGSALSDIDSDLEILINSLNDAGSDLQFAQWVLRPRTATYLARLRGSGGAPAFPGMSAKGGTLLGLPAITSANVPASADSAAETSICLIDAAQISVADDSDAELGVSTEATLSMQEAPATGAEEQVSLWQMNLVAVRMVLARNWKARQAAACSVLTGVQF
jgi:hypothetical protein